jgi:hypothetical protein
MSNIFDVCVVGLGVAGTFACLKIAKDHKNTKVIGIEIGRGPAKRRQQLFGWLGSLPSSDGKLYQNDLSKVADITGLRRAKKAHTWFKHIMEQVNDFKVIKDRAPVVALEKKIKKLGYEVCLNDYIQMYPKEIHSLSKYMADTIEHDKNITFSFENEAVRISKQKNVFIVATEKQEYRCKKLIIAVGRSGWRWAKSVYSNFGIIDSNDIARFGIRIEANSSVMKDFNRTNCSLIRGDVEIGPFSWFGTVIPEDHSLATDTQEIEMAISAFRSNEARWKTDKVSFSLIGSRPFPNRGVEEADRIGQLTFTLSNDRILKERVSSLMHGRSKISILSEYDWLKPTIAELATAVPEIATKAYFHVPCMIPTVPKINLGDNLESEVDGMFLVGESAGIMGILAAGLTGIVAGDAACK